LLAMAACQPTHPRQTDSHREQAHSYRVRDHNGIVGARLPATGVVSASTYPSDTPPSRASALLQGCTSALLILAAGRRSELARDRRSVRQHMPLRHTAVAGKRAPTGCTSALLILAAGRRSALARDRRSDSHHIPLRHTALAGKRAPTDSGGDVTCASSLTHHPQKSPHRCGLFVGRGP